MTEQPGNPRPRGSGPQPPHGPTAPGGQAGGPYRPPGGPGGVPPNGGPGYRAGDAPPPYGAPPGGPPPLQRPGKKGRGGRIALIVVAVVLVVLIGGGYLAYRAITNVVGDVTGGSLADAGAGCSFVSGDDVEATLGGTYDLVELGGFGGIAGVALDSRVLPEAPTCWGVDEADGKLVRIARYEGADAADVFARERATAQGTGEDQGNGVTVSTSSYLGEDVQAGDEAFCTTGDGTTAAGALVRVGEKLVYVSTTAAGQGAEAPPEIDLSGENPGFATDGENCRLSADLASAVG